jgi:hypothetical protein
METYGMTVPQVAPGATIPIAQASQAGSCYKAALAYHNLGMSVLPLKGKRPSLNEWKQHQTQHPTAQQINSWQGQGLLENVGIICGGVSGNLVVLDFDGPGAYGAFAALFPALTETYTIKTGSGEGKHVYLYVDRLPPTTRALDTPIGHIELRAEGCYVVAPPSTHPVTGKTYEVEKPLDILRVPNLDEVVAWIEKFKAPQPEWRPPRDLPPVNGSINPEVISAIADHLRQGRHRENGEWINCSCVYPERHKNGDRHPSFGLNTRSGFGFCYRCGTILAKDICEVLNIDPIQYGGLVKSSPAIVAASSGNGGVPISLSQPIPVEKPLPPIGEIALPDWLSQYTAWASRVGNQTPITFHQAAGIWLLSVSIARRLYVEAPWGVKLYANMYMMLVADTTFYRKTTAYKLAESAIRQAIPHMLMPTPGSPERFQDMLAGRLANLFAYEWVSQRLHTIIQRIADAMLGCPVEIVYTALEAEEAGRNIV